MNQHWHTASYFRWFKWHCHMSTLSITNCLHGYVTLFLFSWFLRPKGSMVQKLSCHSMDWQAAGGSRSKDENRTEIFRTEPYHFLYLIRSNPYFLVRLYCFRFRIWDVSYFKCKSRKRFTYFSTVFYFSTFNLKYSEFKIRFKPNLANCTGHTAQL